MRQACRRWRKSTRQRRDSACAGKVRSSSKWCRTPGATPTSRGRRLCTAEDKDRLSRRRQTCTGGMRFTERLVDRGIENPFPTAAGRNARQRECNRLRRGVQHEKDRRLSAFLGREHV